MLGLLQSLWTFTMDLYLPAFPAIGQDLAIRPSAVQLTLTSALVGMAVGQVVVGPLSDVVGRRRPLLVAVTAHTLASVACALSPTVDALVAARFAQGVGAAAAGILAISIVRDHYAGADMVRMLARMSAVYGTAIVIAPSVGAGLLVVTDWRGLFLVLAGVGAVVLAVAGIGVGESLPRERRRPAGLAPLRRDYAALLRDRAFLRGAVVGALVWAALFLYISASSFLYQDVYRLDPSLYAVLFAASGLAMVVGTQVNALLTARLRLETLALVGLATMVAATVAMSVATATSPSFLAVFAPVTMLMLGLGFTNPCLQALAFADHGERAGTAASALGACRQVAGAVVAPAAGLLGETSPTRTAVLMLVLLVGAVAAFLVTGRRRPSAQSN